MENSFGSLSELRCRIFLIEHIPTRRGLVCVSRETAETTLKSHYRQAWRTKQKRSRVTFANKGRMASLMRQTGLIAWRISELIKCSVAESDDVKDRFIEELGTAVPRGFNNLVGGKLVDDTHAKKGLARAAAAIQRRMEKKAREPKELNFKQLRLLLMAENIPVSDPRWETYRKMMRDQHERTLERQHRKDLLKTHGV